MFSLRRNFRKYFTKFIPAIFLLQALGAMPSVIQTAQAVDACTSSQFTVEAKHNSVFYIDTAKSITSNYAQFKITNKTGSAVTGYWAKIENFSASGGSKLAIASQEVAAHEFFASPANNEFVNLYWYLTASAASNAVQNFDVVIYNGDPTVLANAVCKVSTSFSSVVETIAASSNKITSLSYSNLPSANSNGSETFTATVAGQTGTIGAGPSGDSDVNLSPATASAFPAKNYRLSNTKFICGGNTVEGQLFIANACAGNYTAEFTFQYLSSTFDGSVVSSDKKISPILQIASGTQMKHTTPLVASSVPVIGAPSTTTNAATNISTTGAKLNGKVNSGTMSSVYFCFKASATAVTFTPPCTGETQTATVVPGTTNTYVSDVTGLSAATKYYFELVGVSSGTAYQGGVLSFVTSLAGVSDTTTAASSITISGATLNGNSTGIASGSVAEKYFLISDVDPSPGLHLDPATDDTVTATASFVSTTGTFTANSSGLLAGTKYYYELIIVDTSGSYYYGGLQNFTTLAITTFDPNGGTLTSGNATDTATATVGTDGLLNKPATNPSRSGYTFAGWSLTASGSVVTTHTLTGSQTYFAKWSAVVSAPVVPPVTITWPTPSTITHPTPLSGTQLNATALCNGNAVTGTYKYTPALGEILLPGTYTLSVTFTPSSGGCQSATTSVQITVRAPTPPTITNISAPEVCAVGSQLTVTGTNLNGATAKVDGVVTQVLSSSNTSMLLSLPARSVGTKTIVVTNADGTASTTVKYTFIDTPNYVNYIYPETFKNKDFSYVFKATNAEKYSIVGTMPTGLTLNPLTGELSGAPTVEGNFVFTIVASNLCDDAHLIVYMFVDREIPTAFTCSVQFNVPKSDNITDYKLANLKTCLDKIKTITPKYIEPVIYLSGGVPTGLSSQEALIHPRYIKIIDFIKSIGLDYQFYVGAFGGSTDTVQLNVYWPTT